MENNQQHQSGFHAFLRGIILFGFTMLLLSLIISGSIQYYIAPKMMPFIYFGVISFFVLSIVQILRSTPKGQREEMECDCEADHHMSGPIWKKIAIYSIFILPLLMGFLLPDKVLDSSVAANRGVQLGGGVYSNAVTSATESKIVEQAGSEPKDTEEIGENTEYPLLESEADKVTETDKQEFDRVDQFMNDINQEDDIEHFTVEDTFSNDNFFDYYDQLTAQLLSEDHIVITDENYLDMMTVLDLYLEEFVGKSIEIMGFTYREYGMQQDEIVAARFSMTCCTADSAVYGLLVKGEQTKQIENDTWIRVTGTLEESEFHDWVIPSIVVESIEEVPEPDTPYVYPNFY